MKCMSRSWFLSSTRAPSLCLLAHLQLRMTRGAATQNYLHEANDHPPRAAGAKGQTEQSENAPQSVEDLLFGGSKR